MKVNNNFKIRAQQCVLLHLYIVLVNISTVVSKDLVKCQDGTRLVVPQIAPLNNVLRLNDSWQTDRTFGSRTEKSVLIFVAFRPDWRECSRHTFVKLFDHGQEKYVSCSNCTHTACWPTLAPHQLHVCQVGDATEHIYINSEANARKMGFSIGKGPPILNR